MVTCCFWWWQW